MKEKLTFALVLKMPWPGWMPDLENVPGIDQSDPASKDRAPMCWALITGGQG